MPASDDNVWAGARRSETGQAENEQCVFVNLMNGRKTWRAHLGLFCEGKEEGKRKKRRRVTGSDRTETVQKRRKEKEGGEISCLLLY